MSDPIPLSRKFLSDTGGWKEMKQARSLHAAGKVSDASYQNGWLEGLVREGSKVLKVRVHIRSRTDVENHCPCFRARRDGIICAHALAVGLEAIEPTRPVAPAGQAGPPGSNVRPSSGKRDVELSPDWPVATDIAREDAVPARLYLVIPPHLAGAWEKGTLTIGVEIETGGERKLLKAARPGGPLFFETHDLLLYERLQALSPANVPGMMPLGRDDFLRLLSVLPGHPGVFFGRKQAVAISAVPLRPPLHRTGALRFAVTWPKSGHLLAGERDAWFLEGDTPPVLRPVAPGLPEKWRDILTGPLTVGATDTEDALAALRRSFDCESVPVSRQTPGILVEIEGSLNHLDLVLRFDYGGTVVPAGESLPAPATADDSIILPDLASESSAIRDVVAWGFQGPGAGGKFTLKEKSAILAFLAHGFDRLRADWSVETGERFAHAASLVEPVTAELRFEGSGEDWFAMEVAYETSSGDRVSRDVIRRLLETGQNSTKRAGGRIAVLDTAALEAFQEAITDCEPDQDRPGHYRIGRAQAGYLQETADDYGLPVQGETPWGKSAADSELLPLSGELEGILRPYQRDGVAWLQEVNSRCGGGILADDMGLGKTPQTLAFLRSAGGPALVVCPSSLVSNWVDEAARFVPDLKAVALEGPGRHETLADHADADLFVTSYALLRRDADTYKGRHFRTIVLDEAQHIKNPAAQVSKTAHALQADYRIALTGTPVENSVRDLWSIVQFAIPGYLGRRKDFEERFEKPLAKQGAPQALRERLARRLRPVILRRLKENVATDLPEKIEQVVPCDLTPTQREVYDKLLRESRESVLDAEGGRRRMLALTALLRLRQTCCDLRLLGMEGIDPDDASIKGAALEELLANAIDGGHRVLVFSQFVEMLQLLVPVLAEQGRSFCYLDGSTRNRGDVVKRFQEDDSIPVFLISLKAGGTGLNLTGADTVIHVDPWWNPAVEAQATDRAHRIGQTRTVNSYKLIARATVEEKILSLQAKKKEIADSLLLGGAAEEASLTDDELVALFE